MIKKLLKQHDTIQPILDKLSSKEIIPLFHQLLTEKNISLQKRYHLLSELFDVQNSLPEELYEAVLQKLFHFYKTENYFEKLKKYYQAAGKYKELLQLMDYFVLIVEDDLKKAEIYTQLGVLNKDILLDSVVALKFFNIALQINPDSEEISEYVEDILMAQENWEKIVKNYEDKLAQIEDPSLKSVMCINIANLYLTNSDDIEKSQYYLKEAIRLYPENEDIPLLMNRVFIETNTFETLIESLMDFYKSTNNTNYTLLLKELFKNPKVVSKSGFKIYEQLLSIDPNNQEIFKNAVDYAIENGHHKDILALAETMSDKDLTKDYQIFLTNFIVEFTSEYMDDLEKAEKFAKKSQRLDPDNFKYDYIYLEYYKFTGNSRKVLEILTKNLKETENIQEQIKIHQEIADVAEASQNIFKATDSYKAILKLDPENSDAKESLKKIYRDGAKWRALMEMLKGDIDYLEQKSDKNLSEIVNLYEELIELSITQLNQDPTMLYKKLLEHDATHIPALNFLLEKSKTSNRWNEYIKILAQKADAIDDESGKIEIFFEVAQAYIDHLKKPLEGAFYFEQILNIDPSNGDALDRLKQIYQQAQKPDKLYHVMLKEVFLSNSDDSKIELLISLYHFVEENIKREKALFIDVLEKILTIDSNNIFALQKILEFAEGEDDKVKQKDVLLHLYNLDPTADVILKLAKIFENLDSNDDAIKYYKEYLQYDKNSNIIEIVVLMLLKKRDFEEIDSLFTTLELWENYYQVIYRIIKECEELEIKKSYSLKAIAIAEVYISDESYLKNALLFYHNAFKDSIEIIDKLYQIYSLENNREEMYSLLGNKQQLISNIEERVQILNELSILYIEDKKFDECFQNEKGKFLLTMEISILDNLAEIAAELNNKVLLANTLIEILRVVENVDLKENLYNRVINIYNDLERYDDSKQLSFELIELKPEVEEYVNNIIDILELIDDYKSLNTAYEKKLKFLNSEEKITLLEKMALIALEKWSSSEDAAKYLEQIIEIDSTQLKTVNTLLKIYSTTKQYDSWIRVALLKSVLQQGKDKKETLSEIALCYLEEKNDLPKFIEYTEKSLLEYSDREYYETLLSILKKHSDLSFANLLISNLSKTEFKDLEKALFEHLLSVDFDKSTLQSLNYKYATLLDEKFADFEAAYNIKKGIYLKSLDNNELLNELELLSEKKADFQDLTATLLKLKDDVSEKMAKINILARLGKIYDIYLKEHKKAQSFYNQILQEDSENLTVLTALEKIYLDSKNYDMLFEILEKKYKLLKNHDEKIKNRIAVAKVKGLYFNKIDEALLDLDKIINIDETIIDAYLAKKEFYQLKDDKENILKILFRMEHQLKNSGEEFLKIVSEVVSIYTQMGNIDKAVEHYFESHDMLVGEYQSKLRERLFQLLDENSELLEKYSEEVIPFLTNRKLFEDLVTFYNILISKEDEISIKELYFKNILTIYESSLKNREKTLESLFPILLITKDVESTLSKISNSYQGVMDVDTLTSKLDSIADEKKEYSWMIYNEIGKIYENHQRDDSSEIFYLKAFYASPQQTELFEMLKELFEVKEDWEKLKDIVMFRAEAIEDDSFELLKTGASILLNKMDLKKEAAEVYERVFINLHENEIFTILREIYNSLESWEELAVLYQNAASFEEDGDKKKEYLNIGADLLFNRLQKPEKAVEILMLMIDLEPDNIEIYQKLEDIVKSTSDYQSLDNLFEKKLRYFTDDELIQNTLLERAVNSAVNLKNSEYAVQYLQKLLELNPYNENGLKYLEELAKDDSIVAEATTILEPIYEILGFWDKLVLLLERVENLIENEEAKKAFINKIINIYKDNLQQYEMSLKFAFTLFKKEPQNSDVLDTIYLLLDTTGNYSDFITVIDEILPSLENEVKFEILKHKLSISENYTENQPKSVEALLELIKLENENIEWYEKAAHYLESLENYTLLVDVLKEQVKYVDDIDGKIATLYRVAEIYKENLSMSKEAVEIYRSILEIDVNQAMIYDDLESILSVSDSSEIQKVVLLILENTYKTVSEWDRYTEILNKKLQFLQDENDKKELFLTIALTQIEYIGDFEAAFRNLVQAFIIDFSEITLGYLFKVSETLGNYEDLVTLLSELLPDIENVELQQLIHYKSGNIYFEFLGDMIKAKNSFLKLSNYREDYSVLKKLELIYQEEGAFAELESIYISLIPLMDSNDEKIDTYLKLAALQEELGKTLETKDSYKKLIELKPDHLHSLRALETLSLDNNRELVDIYKLILNAEIGEEERSSTLLKLAKIYKKESNNESESLWKETLELGIDKKEAFIELIEYYGKNENWDLLAEYYENYLSEFAGEIEEPQLISHFEKLANIYYREDKLNMPSFALQNYQKILEVEPTHILSLMRMKEIYRKFDSLDEQFETIRQLIQVLEQGLEEEEQKFEDSYIISQMNLLNLPIKKTLLAYYDEFASLLFENSAFEEMIQISIKHLEANPKNSIVIDRLEQVYEQLEMFDELIYILEEKRSILSEQTEIISTYEKMAEISLDKLSSPDRAISYFKEILKLEPENLTVIERIESLYESLTEWDELVSILKLKIDAIENKLPVYEKIVTVIIENSADYEEGFSFFEKAYSLYPNEDSLIDLFYQLASVSMLWERFIKSAERILPLTTENSIRDNLLFKVAEVYRDELNLAEYSIKTYQLLSSYQPENKEIYLKLEELFLLINQWEELAKVYEKLISLEEDSGLQREYYYKLGVHFEANINSIERTAKLYEKMIQTYPEELEALDNLERIYSDIEDFNSLVKIYKHKISVFDDLDLQIELYQKIATIAEEKNNISLKIEAYNEILKRDPNSAEAYSILEEYYQSKNSTEDLLIVYNHLIEQNSSFKIDSIIKKAEILKRDETELNSAIELYRSVLEEYEPNNSIAFKALEEIYENSGEWELLVSLYKMVLDQEDNQEQRVLYLNRVALIYLDKLSLNDEAKEYFEYSLSENPVEEVAVDGLMRIFKTQQQWDDAIDLLSSVAAGTSDPNQAAEAYYEIGRIYLDEMDDLYQAQGAFEQAVQSRFDHADALRMLKDIAYKEEDYANVVNYLDRLKECVDEDEKVSIGNELGVLYYEKLEDTSSSISYFEESLELKPTKTSTEYLSKLYFESEMFDSLSSLYEKYSSLILKSEEIPQEVHYYRDAFANRYLKNSPAKVFELSEKSFNLNRVYRENLELLTDVSFELKKYETVISASKQYLVHYFDSCESNEIGSLYVKLGVAYAGVENFELSNRYFNRALSVDEYNIDALKYAIDAYKQGAQWHKVIEYYNKMIQKITSQEEIIKINYEMGLIYKNELQSYSQALSHFEKVISMGLKNIELLTHMYEIYSKTANYPNMISVLEEQLKLETSEDSAAKICYTLADLYYAKLNNPQKSVSYLLKVLSLNYRNTKVLSAIEQILEGAKAFKDLEEVYKKVYSTLGEQDAELKTYLLEKLGVIYKDIIQDFVKAVEVYETLGQLHPNQQKYYQILIDFYERIPQFYDKAIALHKAKVKQNAKNSTDSIHSLIKLYNEKKLYDKIYCYSAFLFQIGAAHEDEREFYNGYKSATLRRLEQPVGKNIFEKYLNHNHLNKDVSKIMEGVQTIASESLCDKKMKDMKDIDPKKDGLDPNTRFYKLAEYVMQNLGVTGLDFYHIKNNHKGLKFDSAISSSGFFGKGNKSDFFLVGTDMLVDRDEAEAGFYLAKYITLALPEFYMIQMATSAGTTVQEVYQTLESLNNSSIVTKLPKLQKDLKKSLPADVALTLETASKGGVNINLWLKGAEFTANRVALLFCGDVNSAIKVIKEDQNRLSGASVQEKIDDILEFSISDQYLSLRESLGISIKVK
ncbi:hypothetical protein JXR93_13420 [bacterium]|nr:hypothetical protein [bacterium]